MNVQSDKTVKVLLTTAALLTIVIPSVMDLNSTHMTNPLWPPHARFHWSIQWYSITLLNLGALFLLWGDYREKGTRLSIVIAGIAPLLFWGSFFPSMLMPGTSTWPDGITPFTRIAPNVILAMVLSITSIVGIYRDARLRRRRDSDSGVIPR